MKKIYYRYNPETDNYERVFPSVKGWLISAAKVAVATIVLTTLLCVIVFYGFASPTEKALRQENADLNRQLKEMDGRVSGALAVMEDIQARDDNFYRVMMQMEPLGRQRRFGGLMSGTATNVGRLTDDKLVQAVGTKISLLERSLYAQSQSFDMLRRGVTGHKDKLAHIPSVLPINIADYTISSGYGNRRDPIYGTTAFHAGLDFPAPEGTGVFATADGEVTQSGWRGTYGNCVEVDHGYGYVTRYAHLSQIDAAPGTEVRRGDKIGEVGSTGKSTGPHLHYEVRYKGEAQNPVGYYFMDITAEQYDEMVRMAASSGNVMD